MKSKKKIFFRLGKCMQKYTNTNTNTKTKTNANAILLMVDHLKCTKPNVYPRIRKETEYVACAKTQQPCCFQ